MAFEEAHRTSQHPLLPFQVLARLMEVLQAAQTPSTAIVEVYGPCL